MGLIIDSYMSIPSNFPNRLVRANFTSSLESRSPNFSSVSAAKATTGLALLTCRRRWADGPGMAGYGRVTKWCSSAWMVRFPSCSFTRSLLKSSAWKGLGVDQMVAPMSKSGRAPTTQTGVWICGSLLLASDKKRDRAATSSQVQHWRVGKLC